MAHRTRHSRRPARPLTGVNLPAASPFVNPDSAHLRPQREAFDAATVAGGAKIKPGQALHRGPLDTGAVPFMARNNAAISRLLSTASAA